jgi:hypothetical protein
VDEKWLSIIRLLVAVGGPFVPGGQFIGPLSDELIQAWSLVKEKTGLSDSELQQKTEEMASLVDLRIGARLGEMDDEDAGKG